MFTCVSTKFLLNMFSIRSRLLVGQTEPKSSGCCKQGICSPLPVLNSLI